MSRNRAEGTSTPTSATQVEASRTRLTGTLRLRGEPLPTQTDSTEQGPSSSRRIRWAEDVVDNEGLGRKSSKVCCIFHKSRPAGESSSESDSEPSSSSDESDSDMDTGEARASGSRRRAALQQRQRGQECSHHEHDGDNGHPHSEDDDDNDRRDDDKDNDEPDKRNPSRRKRKYRPNAYERMPNYNIKKANGGKEQG